ncbi:MAG: pyridoxamine 5'-phosphate oxidase family protein [Oscillospiraceae bacterium]
MKELTAEVVDLLNAQPLWYVGTFSDMPNTSIIGFKEVLDDGHLLLCNVFMNYTLTNIKKNGKISITVCCPETMQAYMVSGTAEYLAESEHLERWKAVAQEMTGGKLTPKGVVIVTPESVRVLSANRKNGTEL